MFFRYTLVIAAAVAGTLASPVVSPAAPLSSSVFRMTTTSVQCYTSFASTSVRKVKTSTLKSTTRPPPLIGTSTYTPRYTVTPAPVTVTSTSFTGTIVTITVTPKTDTFYTTSTHYSTDTSTITPAPVTSTIPVVTTTTSTSTSTIPAISGFLPIADTTAGLDYLLGRGVDTTNVNTTDVNNTTITNASALKYPAAVDCLNNVEILTVTVYKTTAKTKTTTLAPLTSTITPTATITSISTVVPFDISTTLSFDAFNTTTITTVLDPVTTTTTSSSTVVLSTTTTWYAACATNNVLTQNNGGIIAGYLPGYDAINQTDSYSPAPAAYDCCVQCQNTADCAYSYWLPTQKACFMGHNPSQTCQQRGYAGGQYVEIANDPFYVAVSNGNCGYMYDGGVYGQITRTPTPA